MRIGVPRALLFHQYGNCWTAFLEAAGFEVVLTEETNAGIVVTGTEYADNETCLPVKVFAGHLLQLKGNCDAVLVPRVVSQYHSMKACPKYLGLPDVARALDRDLPPVLSPVMDLADGRRRWTGEWASMAIELGSTAAEASAAVKVLLRRLGETEPVASSPVEGRLTVGIAGHLYNILDNRASLGIVERARSQANVVTVDRLSRRQIRRELRTLGRRIRWDYESRIVGGVLHWSRTASVDGIIYVTSFACGPGSMIGALLEDQLGHEKSVPFMSVTLDEHSAEGGLVTRVEAFMDVLGRSTSRHVFAKGSR